MTLSPYVTLPNIKGTVGATSPFGTILTKVEHLVYPYQLGCFTKAYSAGIVTSFNTSGEGEFIVGDYVLPCRPVSYGGTWYYVPDLTSITRVTALGVSSDTVDVSPGIAQTGLMYLFNLGTDTSSNPLVNPNYDGSTISTYVDATGAVANSQPYFTTNLSGMFNGWVESGIQVCSLLICNSSGTPIIAIPQYPVGAEILTV